MVTSFNDQIIYSDGDDLEGLLLLASKLHESLMKADRKQIDLVMPYIPFSRHDKPRYKHITLSHQPSLCFVADLLCPLVSGKIICVDLHNPTSEYFFRGKLENNTTLLVELVEKLIKEKLYSKKAQLVIVSPDQGSKERVKNIASKLDINWTSCVKERTSSVEQNITDNPNMISPIKSLILLNHEIVNGKHVLLVDDIIESGQTLALAAQACLLAGCSSVHTFALHSLCSSGSIDRLQKAGIVSFTTTNTVQMKTKMSQKSQELDFYIMDAMELLLK